ncbi:MAG TPA: type I methionyl aminopeptidase [Clostridiales bacterium]|nr:type I methionyl aminopeptidase [Clostridiales bacterium]
MVEILSNEELDKMRKAGALVAKILKELEKAAVPGVSTKELDDIAQRIIREAGGSAPCIGYGEPPFPAAICTSINEVVVHGIPSSRVILKDGDIVTCDVVAELDGFNGDAARTFLVGNVSEEKRLLVERTKEAFFKGLAQVKIGNRIGDVSHAVQEYAESFGYGVVRVLTGHGIGRSMHEDPEVPNYGKPGRGHRILKGMAFCVEPMINMGTEKVYLENDGWTVVTADGKPAAHYENTIIITENGPEMTTYEEDV